MLDVHPPHASVHTWRDFFIHIATIVVGLLIAIGLEQGVERLHERHQAHEASEALQREFEDNHNRIGNEISFWRRGTAALENNLLVLRHLQQHPDTPEEKLPGTLYWGISHMVFAHAEWDSTQQTGIIKLLPQSVATTQAFYYLELQRVEESADAVWLAINDAEAFSLADPNPTHLAPPQLAEVITLTERALTKQVLLGEALLNLNASDPNLPQNITREELNQVRNRQDQKSNPALAAADALTLARLKAANPSEKK
jgi:hypothetical protein